MYCCPLPARSHHLACARQLVVSAGAVNHNLQAMKQRVNSTLVTFESVTRALEATALQLKKEQARAVS